MSTYIFLCKAIRTYGCGCIHSKVRHETVSSFTSLPLCPPRKSLRYQINGRTRRFQRRSRHWAKETNLSPLHGILPKLFGVSESHYTICAIRNKHEAEINNEAYQKKLSCCSIPGNAISFKIIF